MKTKELKTRSSRIETKVLTPSGPGDSSNLETVEVDPFYTSFAVIAPSKTELKLLAKEFSCEEEEKKGELDLLEPSDDIFQVKALTPEPSETRQSQEDF
ncbi:hypothetical protein F3G64_35520, partial [Pseudomonas aeruginosa]